MKNIYSYVNSVIFLLLFTLFPILGAAAPMMESHCYKRPLSDFLDSQGSTILFFPPARDMLAWTDFEFVNFALVDYAGLANDYIASASGQGLGTNVKGRVKECLLNDGTAEVSIVIATSKALGFAQSVEDLFATFDPETGSIDFLNTPTIFGNKPQDILGGADAALGPASFRVSFVIDNPGDPLPDLRIAFQQQPADYAPLSLSFRSTTVGTLPDGTKARLRIQQVAAWNEDTATLEFTRDIVEINRR